MRRLDINSSIETVSCPCRPRLGPLLTKVLLLGIVYFTLCATEGYLDATTVALHAWFAVDQSLIWFNVTDRTYLYSRRHDCEVSPFPG